MIGFYFITDSGLSLKGNISDVRQALCSGVRYIQYRNKSGDSADMMREALILRKITKGRIFIIDDRLDICQAVNADGVHLGQSDLPLRAARKILGKKRIIGVTVHSLREALRAEREGADYLGVAPVFHTSTKKSAQKPVGVSLIKKIKKYTDIPIVAIGGITLDNAGEVIAAGSSGVCAISAVVSKRDVGKEIRKFQGIFSKK